jgi:hypothetical protein
MNPPLSSFSSSFFLPVAHLAAKHLAMDMAMNVAIDPDKNPKTKFGQSNSSKMKLFSSGNDEKINLYPFQK